MSRAAALMFNGTGGRGGFNVVFRCNIFERDVAVCGNLQIVHIRNQVAVKINAHTALRGLYADSPCIHAAERRTVYGYGYLRLSVAAVISRSGGSALRFRCYFLCIVVVLVITAQNFKFLIIVDINVSGNLDCVGNQFRRAVRNMQSKSLLAFAFNFQDADRRNIKVLNLPVYHIRFAGNHR